MSIFDKLKEKQDLIQEQMTGLKDELNDIDSQKDDLFQWKIRLDNMIKDLRYLNSEMSGEERSEVISYLIDEVKSIQSDLY